jgi:hypothetical protein
VRIVGGVNSIWMLEHDCDIRDSTGEPVEHGEACLVCEGRRQSALVEKTRQETRQIVQSRPRPGWAQRPGTLRPPWETEGDAWFLRNQIVEVSSFDSPETEILNVRPATYDTGYG